LEPPAEYLEEDITSKDDQRVPPDALYMLQSIRYYSKYFTVTFSIRDWCLLAEREEGWCSICYLLSIVICTRWMEEGTA
jgi:hypothetical protein